MLLNKKQNHIFIEVERYFGETDLDLGKMNFIFL